ncbi:hypothetical protein [Chlamydia abortus]|nr:hypothetical protein [Chlamydia abortus]AUS59958.1 uncharacterized protein CHAB577_0537 [Chlamydia abortus]SFV97780.1 Uncharacterised protein [Chlamydia abortus]SFV97781.1 Uncharacterised protein [Chlamydia abortus]SFV99016.1 Uncharacterised protein [Chlamydia abortus]SFW00840.1 Uncharacterised protein [Chlamydia abortus]
MSSMAVLGPRGPFSSPFTCSLYPTHLKMHLLGSIPIVGIYIGAKRIAAVAQYHRMCRANTGVSQVIIQDFGEGKDKVQDVLSYTLGHYFRGIVECLGLGVVLTILEFVIAAFKIIFSFVVALMATLSLVIVHLGVINMLVSRQCRQYNEHFPQKSHRFELLIDMVSPLVRRF